LHMCAKFVSELLRCVCVYPVSTFWRVFVI